LINFKWIKFILLIIDIILRKYLLNYIIILNKFIYNHLPLIIKIKTNFINIFFIFDMILILFIYIYVIGKNFYDLDKIFFEKYYNKRKSSNDKFK